MNRLAKEKSAYLQHAARQKIDWYPWSDEPFERSRQENKPVFLSSGAVWCHWCHVMAKESFESEEVAAILNQDFIAVKLDRDENPDIDRRYQQAVGAMGMNGGWPLSVFLTSDRKPFYGGTYFPPDDAFGRTGFKTILRAISDLYKRERQKVEDTGKRVLELVRPSSLESGDLRESLIQEGAQAILRIVDRVHGGFGDAPKFPMSGALEFLLGRYLCTKDSALGGALKTTLMSMARGGFHDHLGGGFHRYSTDAGWTIPHFEKMADDNAWLLRNFADAFRIFGDSCFRDVAQGIVLFTRRELSHPDGGFFASQDADVTPDDEGGYFTWSDDEFKTVLDEQEYQVLSRFFLHDRGGMHHNPSKRVLYVTMDVEVLARELGMEKAALSAILEKGKGKLLGAREKREKPLVDKALYTSLNGMLISAYLKAFRALGDEEMKQFALKSLGRVLDVNVDGDVVSHGQGVKGLLDDYVNLVDALIGAYEATGRMPYLTEAETIFGLCIERFWDNREGGFYDTEEEILGLRLKEIADTPHPSANSLAIILLLKLSFIVGNEGYRTLAEKALRAFSHYGQRMGVHGAYYLCGLDAYFSMLELTINAPCGSELAGAALSTVYPYKAMVYGEDRGSVTPCFRHVCSMPAHSAESLRKVLATSLVPSPDCQKQ
jgi:uncharacterized protein